MPPRKSTTGGRASGVDTRRAAAKVNKRSKNDVSEEPEAEKPALLMDMPARLCEFLVEDSINIQESDKVLWFFSKAFKGSDHKSKILDMRPEEQGGPPTKLNVVEILEGCKDDLLESGFKLRENEEPSTESLITTINKGLVVYFERYALSLFQSSVPTLQSPRTIGNRLQYEQERPQYTHYAHLYQKGPHIDIGTNDISLAHVYGVEHLLRLIGMRS